MTTAPHRILLVPDARPRPHADPAPKLRRYRLARLRVAETRQPTEPRFEHIARAYD
ncbi:MAG TPA: hypothetical protein VHF89_17195 [Solirubrobacteraceae bacterium]|nr:hypothetical protein [Solirubrobacteraceae bacterium]